MQNVDQTKSPIRPVHYLIYGLLGVIFGITLVKSEVVSWFRIQEMFRFQAFHMYGVIGSAVFVAAISTLLFKRSGIRDMFGREVIIPDKEMNKGFNQAAGGLIFGFGWALTGACPGPIYSLMGAGYTVMVVALIAALFGTWLYGSLKHKLPH